MEQSAFSRPVRVLSCVTVLVIFVALAVSFSLPSAIAGPSYVAYDKNTMTWTVSPSGGDDTRNVQYAFNQAVSAGTGSTVELTVGQFYCNNIVVTGFDGTFRGAGKGVTRVDTLRGLDPNAPPLSNPIDLPSLFAFVGGNVRISDMTLEITSYWTTVTYGKQAFGMALYLTDAMVRIDGRNANSLVERVQFIGHEGAGYSNPDLVPDNCHVGIRISDLCDFKSTWGFHVGPTTGTHIVKQCEFTRFTEAIAIFGLSNGRALIGGGAGDANTFMDSYASVMTRNIEGSAVEISYNFMGGSRGCQIFCYNDIRPQEKAMPIDLITSPSQVLISHNTMDFHGGWGEMILSDAIVLDDDGPSYGAFLKKEAAWSLKAVISNNKIRLDYLVGGIYGFGIQDAVVTGNEVSGRGLAGIYIAPGPYGYYGWLETCSHWTLSGNNFENLDAEVAQVWLGPFSDHCTVVGGCKNMVWDQGTDNLLVGVNNMGSDVSVGESISDAMEKKHDLMKSMW